MKNCLTYALGMWIRFGGYLLIRRSLLVTLHELGPRHVFNLVPHFLHKSKYGVVTQLIRTDAENARAKELGPWLDWLWLWHFDGHVVTGDIGYEKSEIK